MGEFVEGFGEDPDRTSGIEMLSTIESFAEQFEVNEFAFFIFSESQRRK